MKTKREWPTAGLAIKAYLHCGKCIKEKPNGISARDYAKLEVGWSPVGLQIWCRRHGCNVVHIDFEGTQHPATTKIAKGV